jgi:hypothetical protein
MDLHVEMRAPFMAASSEVFKPDAQIPAHT